MSRQYFASAAAVLCAVSTCSSPLPPSSALVGDWGTRLAPSHFDFIYLRFEQNGSSLTGTACRQDGGTLLYSSVQVAIQYPRVRFEVKPQHVAACCQNLVGDTFDGTFNPDGSLTGFESRHPGDVRMSTPGGNLCALAR